MKRILMAIMAVAVAVTFSAPAFAGDPPKETTKKETKAPKQMIYGDEKKDTAKPAPKPEEKGK
jgi:Flp pilus assembly protein TadD